MGRQSPVAGRRLLRGVTLIELAVALAVLGVVLAVAGLGVRTPRAPAPTGWVAELELARRNAALRGTATTVTRDGRSVRFAPDGSATGGPLLTATLVLRVDPLTGRVHAEPR